LQSRYDEDGCQQQESNCRSETTPRTTSAALLSCSQPSKCRRLTRCDGAFVRQHRRSFWDDANARSPSRRDRQSPVFPIEGTGRQGQRNFGALHEVHSASSADRHRSQEGKSRSRQTIPKLVQDASADLSLRRASVCPTHESTAPCCLLSHFLVKRFYGVSYR